MCAVYVTEVAWAVWNQTLVTTLEHQIGGSCDLGERPGEPGVQGQPCLSMGEFRQPGRRTMDGSEGSGRTPSRGGTRHCIDTLLSEQHLEGALSMLLELIYRLLFPEATFLRGPQLNSQTQAILRSLL